MDLTDEGEFRAWCAQALSHATEALKRDPSYEATIAGATLLRLLESAARAWDEGTRQQWIARERVQFNPYRLTSPPGQAGE